MFDALTSCTAWEWLTESSLSTCSSEPRTLWVSNGQRCCDMKSEDYAIGARGWMSPSWLCLVQSRDVVVDTEIGCANHLHDLSSKFWSGRLRFSVHGEEVNRLQWLTLAPHWNGLSSRHVCKVVCSLGPRRFWRNGNDQRWCTSVVENPALESDDFCHQVAFCPRCVRRRAARWWKCFRVLSNDFCFGCLWFFILVSMWFHVIIFWMRHGVGMEWSSAAIISNMSKRFAFLLEVKRSTVFFFAWSVEIPAIGREDRCHQVGLRPRSSRCGHHNVWCAKSSDAESREFWSVCLRFSVLVSALID